MLRGAARQERLTRGASARGREPGAGEIHCGDILPLIDRIGYDGWVGCAYRPTTTVEAGLGWMNPYRR